MTETADCLPGSSPGIPYVEKGSIQAGTCLIHGTLGDAGVSCAENTIILCDSDSWYVKQSLVSVLDEYENLDLVGNAKADSVIYDLPPALTGKKGRPAKHALSFVIECDCFCLLCLSL